MMMRLAPVLALIAAVATGLLACSAEESAAPAADTPAAAAPEPAAVPEAPAATPPPTELVVTDMTLGEGEAVVPGQVAVMHYTGWLYDPAAPENKGAKFDSSLDRNDPFPFQLGAGEVIAGWDQGVAGMKKGGKRRLVIPPGLAYGDSGAVGVIPPGATLVFDVELLEIKTTQ